MATTTFKCYDNNDITRWCELTATVREREAGHGMTERYDVTYTVRYSGAAADCVHLHPLAAKPAADTDGVIVPVQPATTELVRIIMSNDEAIIEQAGRQLAGLPRGPKEVRERAASARRAVAIRALAEFWY